MQASVNKLTNPLRALATGTWVAMLSVLTVPFCAANANAQTAPIITTQITPLGVFPAGGWTSSQSPLSGTFVVGANGDVFIGSQWGGNVLEFTPSGANSVLATFSSGNVGPVAMDGNSNVYVAADGYTAHIYKIPYNATTGAYAGFTADPTANCVGGTSDTAACIFAPNFGTTAYGSGQSGVASMAFDATGNLFVATDTLPSTPNTIWECNAACEGGTGTPTLIYSDSKAMGALTVDPWGNLFFSDGSNSSSSGVSGLNELPLKSGTYASTPTLLEAYTNLDTYANGLSGVASGSDGTIYFTTNSDGTFAIPNSSSGGPDLAGAYAVSTVGGYGVTVDPKGNLSVLTYSGGYAVDLIAVNNITVPAAAAGGTATTAVATLIDNAGACTPKLAIAATEFGTATTDFSAKAGTSCSATLGTTNGTFSPALSLSGGVFSSTITFTPTKVGERSAVLTVTDSTNNVSGTATATGVGQGALANLDPGIWSAYTTGFTTPYSVSVDALGDMVVADEAGAVYWIAAGTKTPASIGSGFAEPVATAFDANGNLFVADFKDNDIVEIPNVNGALVPASQSILVAATVTFGGIALSKPSGLAVGPDGVLYISDLGNSRVVTYNPTSGDTAVRASGLKDPWGVAVDAADTLYIANTGDGNVLVYPSTGGFTTLTPAGVTAPWGVVVDPSGSLLISDKGTGNIVRVPTVAGTLTDANAVLVEKNPHAALGLALDAWGDLYTTDSTGAAVYAIQRTAASVDLGTIQDLTTSAPVTVYLENAGNAQVTLGSPAITEPTNTMFTLAVASTNGCADGTSGAPGISCQFTAEFSPTSSATGPESGTASVATNAVDSPATVSMTGTATMSSIRSQTITNFNPSASLLVGQQITLSATGGASGNPVTFTIDAASTCFSCATISGNTLTATAPGAIIVDANQAGGIVSGVTYAAATEAQAPIAVSTATPPGGPGSGIVTSQLTWLGAYPAGGDLAGGVAAGDSFGVNSHGDILISTTYGGTVIFVDGQTGAVTTLGKYGQYGTGGVAVDNNDNLYLGALYGSSNIVAKLPYVNGVYAPLTDATQGTPPANCTGTDTTECVVAPITNISGGFGVASMKFDAQGDLFMATSDQGNPHSIWECTAACLASGTPAPVKLFQEPTGASPSTTGQLYIGGIAVDPSGNLFFTDSNIISPSSNNDTSSYSDLYELAYTAGTGYAATPTLLQTLTIASPGSYDDALDGVGVDASGNVYYVTQDEGIFALPNVSGTIDTSGGYAVSTQGGKGLSYDANGNLYVTGYSTAINTSGAETVARVSLNNVNVPVSQLGVLATVTNVTAMDNFAGCSTSADIAIASSNTEFTATAGTTCSADNTGSFLHQFTGSSYPVTVNFTASSAGPQTGTLTLADTTHGGEGTAAVTGTGQETPQAITFTAPASPVTFAPNLQITLTATGGASGNPVVFSVDGSSTGAGTIAGSTLTVTGAGNLIIDANQVGGLVSGVYYSAAPQVQQKIVVNPTPQTIDFTPPMSPVTFAPNLQIALAATGGASANPVTFTVDANSTGAGTISGDTLTVTGAGTLVIDANQAGSTDFAAAPQVQQSIVVNMAAQTITFTPPTPPIYFIVGGITINLAATGGASGNTVVFTVDAASTGKGTINGNTLTVTAQGNLVIDANQAGDTNYSAAAQAQETIAVLPPLPTQAITFANPGTQSVGVALTLTATASSGLPVIYTSSTTGVCTVSGGTATFVTAGTCTITASQPGDNKTFAAAAPVSQTFTVNPAGQVPTFTFNSSLPSMSIQPGTVGIAQITINPQYGFSGVVSFTCSGLPSGYSCTFNPNPVTVVLGDSATTTLSVNPGTTAAVVPRDSRPLFPAVALSLALCLFGFRKRSRLQLLLLLAVGMAGFGLLSGCGGSSSSATTKSTQSTVTITATAGAITQTSTFTLTVQ